MTARSKKNIFRIVFFIIALYNFIESTKIYRFRFDLDYIYYYTNLSNFAVFIWISYIMVKMVKNQKESKNDYSVKFSVMMGIMVTFIIYNTLLGNPFTRDYWHLSNVLKHTLIPLLMFYDYLKYTPHKKIRFSDTYKSLIFPLLYFVYAMIRGLFTNQYPYFFVDPTGIGYTGVISYLIVLTMLMWGFSYLLYLLNKKRIS